MISLLRISEYGEGNQAFIDLESKAIITMKRCILWIFDDCFCYFELIRCINWGIVMKISIRSLLLLIIFSAFFRHACADKPGIESLEIKKADFTLNRITIEDIKDDVLELETLLKKEVDPDNSNAIESLVEKIKSDLQEQKEAFFSNYSDFERTVAIHESLKKLREQGEKLFSEIDEDVGHMVSVVKANGYDSAALIISGIKRSKVFEKIIHVIEEIEKPIGIAIEGIKGRIKAEAEAKIAREEILKLQRNIARFSRK